MITVYHSTCSPSGAGRQALHSLPVTGLRSRRGGRSRPVRSTRRKSGPVDDVCYRSATWTRLDPHGPDLRKQPVPDSGECFPMTYPHPWGSSGCVRGARPTNWACWHNCPDQVLCCWRCPVMAADGAIRWTTAGAVIGVAAVAAVASYELPCVDPGRVGWRLAAAGGAAFGGCCRRRGRRGRGLASSAR
jgi:hypothetical protein